MSTVIGSAENPCPLFMRINGVTGLKSGPSLCPSIGSVETSNFTVSEYAPAGTVICSPFTALSGCATVIVPPEGEMVSERACWRLPSARLLLRGGTSQRQSPTPLAARIKQSTTDRQPHRQPRLLARLRSRWRRCGRLDGRLRRDGCGRRQGCLWRRGELRARWLRRRSLPAPGAADGHTGCRTAPREGKVRHNELQNLGVICSRFNSSPPPIEPRGAALAGAAFGRCRPARERRQSGACRLCSRRSWSRSSSRRRRNPSL